AELDIAPLPPPELARGEATRRRARRREELLDRDLERGRDLEEDGDRRVRGAGLEVRPRRPGHARDPGELLLGEAPGEAELLHVRGEAPGDVAHVNRLAFGR